MDARLSKLAALSHDQDALLIELVYHGRYVQFDISAMEMKYLSMAEIIDRYFRKAFADVQVMTAERETPQGASSSVTPLVGAHADV